LRIWEDGELGNFLDKKISLIKEALDNDNLPEYAKIPLCDYCPYVSECKAHALDTFMSRIAEEVKNGKPMQRGVLAKGVKKILG